MYSKYVDVEIKRTFCEKKKIIYVYSLYCVMSFREIRAWLWLYKVLVVGNP